MVMNVEVKPLPLISDERGWLAEILKNEAQEPIGQLHFSVSKQGVARGNHYHHQRIEWLLVTSGKGTIYTEDNKTGEKSKIEVNGANLTLVKIPPEISHVIVNHEKEPMYLLVIASTKHTPENPDTYRKEIYPPK
jgi:UDP-2-acetamido-2,6-beta-L-arabino-hexul-4-ose reductase